MNVAKEMSVHVIKEREREREKWRRGDLFISKGDPVSQVFFYFRASDDEGALGNYIVHFCIERFEIMRYYPKRDAHCVGSTVTKPE